MSVAAIDAISDDDVEVALGEALLVGDDAELVDDVVGSAVGELLLAQPVTAANTSAPVAHDLNPSGNLICSPRLLLPSA